LRHLEKWAILAENVWVIVGRKLTRKRLGHCRAKIDNPPPKYTTLNPPGDADPTDRTSLPSLPFSPLLPLPASAYPIFPPSATAPRPFPSLPHRAAPRPHHPANESLSSPSTGSPSLTFPSPTPFHHLPAYHPHRPTPSVQALSSLLIHPFTGDHPGAPLGPGLLGRAGHPPHPLPYRPAPSPPTDYTRGHLPPSCLNARA